MKRVTVLIMALGIVIFLPCHKKAPMNHHLIGHVISTTQPTFLIYHFVIKS